MTYAKLNENERWLWHARYYAFRRVVLGVHEDQVPNPCDPSGKWIDEGLIGAAEKQLAARLAQQREAQERQKAARDRRLKDEGREIVDRWCRNKGYADAMAYCEATGTDRVDLACDIARELLAASPIPAVRGFKTLAGASKL